MQGPNATHGMTQVARRGRDALSPEEMRSLRELRDALRDPQLRAEIRAELVGRLVLIVDRGMAFLDEHPELYGTGKGPLQYMGTYLNTALREIRRWPDPVDEAVRAQELARIERVLGAARDE